MNRSRLAFANFGTNNEFSPTFGPVILDVRRNNLARCDSCSCLETIDGQTTAAHSKARSMKRPRVSARSIAFVVMALFFTYFLCWQITRWFGVPYMGPRRLSPDLIL